MTIEAADAIGRALEPKQPVVVDVAELSNVSFEEMILHFMVESDEEHRDEKNMHDRQMWALCRLFLAPVLPAARANQLIAAFGKTRVFTYSAKLLRREIVAHQLKSGHRIENGAWQAIVEMWFQMLGRAIDGRDDPALVDEAIEADLLSTLELWTYIVPRDPSCKLRLTCAQ